MVAVPIFNRFFQDLRVEGKVVLIGNRDSDYLYGNRDSDYLRNRDSDYL
jgi:hypothetical protein